MIADLVTAGEAFEDLIFADLPRLPHAGEEIKTGAFARTYGGGAVITAVAARRAGLRCTVLSGLSDGAERRLRREGIQVMNLRRPGEPAAITAALSTSGERSFVTFNGVNARLETRLRRASAAVRARHVHLAFAPRRCRGWVTRVVAWRRAGITTSWDPGWNEHLADDRGFPALLQAVDWLLINESEALLFTRRRGIAAAIGALRTAARATVIKFGVRGSRWIAADLDVAAPAPRVRAIDTTGAGDAFNGGFLAALLRGASPRQALAAGNRMGALSTRALGGIDGLPRRAR